VPVTDETNREEAAAAGAETPAGGHEGEASQQAPAGETEVEILRDELRRANERVEQLQREAAEFRDRFLRSRAEFENYRRRMEGELAMARESGMDSMVLPVLAVYDDLERALDAASAAGLEGPFVTNVRAVRDSLVRQLDSLGITPLGQKGELFDPERHEALAAVPAGPGVGDGVIVQVHAAGFAKGERLIRPAKVIVAKEGA
jgi:molecular chaperone GrpE